MADKHNNGKEWGLRILLTITALSVGFGISQLALAGQVRENTTKIEMLENTLNRLELKLDKVLGNN